MFLWVLVVVIALGQASCGGESESRPLSGSSTRSAADGQTPHGARLAAYRARYLRSEQKNRMAAGQYVASAILKAVAEDYEAVVATHSAVTSMFGVALGNDARAPEE